MQCKYNAGKLITLFVVIFFNYIAMAQEQPVFNKWKLLRKIPDKTGFAGSFAGVSNNVLIVAGGSNFPDGGAPWTGSKKVWYDNIFILKKLSGKWEKAGKLPRPLGYGTSVTTESGLIIIGGSNETGHYSDVYRLTYTHNQLKIETLPALPVTLANSCGALAGNTIYIYGGLQHPADTETVNVFYSLNITQPEKGWQLLPPVPGPSRMLGVAASIDDTFYLFSGTSLSKGKRTYLKDGYSYNDKNGWVQLKDIPVPVVAAPTTTYSHLSSVYIFGGDDGQLANKDLKEQHPGFSGKIYEYNTLTNSWKTADAISVNIRPDAVQKPNKSTWAPVTTTLVVWKNKIILPGGEVRPATRTPNVLSASINVNK